MRSARKGKAPSFVKDWPNFRPDGGSEQKGTSAKTKGKKSAENNILPDDGLSMRQVRPLAKAMSRR